MSHSKRAKIRKMHRDGADVKTISGVLNIPIRDVRAAIEGVKK